MKKKIAIFISGRGSNMEAIVKNTRDGILTDCCKVSVVLSDKSNAKGLETAQSYNIPTLCVESKGKSRHDFEEELIKALSPFQVDFIVLAGFMRMLSKTFLTAYNHKIINIHPADTKEFQGLHAYEWAFHSKKESTKITVHYVDEGMDTGTIIAQREVDLRGAKSLQEVERRGLKVEHQFYSEVLRKIFK